MGHWKTCSSHIQAPQNHRSKVPVMEILAGNRFVINLPKEHNCFLPSPTQCLSSSHFFFEAAAKIMLSVSNIFAQQSRRAPREQSMNINNPNSKTEMTPDFNLNIRLMIAIVFSRFPYWRWKKKKHNAAPEFKNIHFKRKRSIWHVLEQNTRQLQAFDVDKKRVFTRTVIQSSKMLARI